LDFRSAGVCCIGPVPKQEGRLESRSAAQLPGPDQRTATATNAINTGAAGRPIVRRNHPGPAAHSLRYSAGVKAGYVIFKAAM
jgi:hypothetical protein